MKLEVINLSKKFNNILAVNNINFSIEKNKTLGLLGPNGCGKTTSIGMMLGLITPSDGVINPSIIPMEVVFPHPFGPNNPKVLFLSIEKLIFFTAKILLNFLLRLQTSNFIIFLPLSLIDH